MAPKVPSEIAKDLKISGTYKEMRNVWPNPDKKVRSHPKLTVLKFPLRK